MSSQGIGSRTVDWWQVYQYASPLLDSVGEWPTAGTLAWQELADTDPRKIAALYEAAIHHTLRVDTAQAAVADAAQTISKTTDWAQAARRMSQRSTCAAYIPRKAQVTPWTRNRAATPPATDYSPHYAAEQKRHDDSRPSLADAMTRTTAAASDTPPPGRIATAARGNKPMHTCAASD